MSYFPMMVDLEGRDVLVIGGGDEGEKKVDILHQFGAIITLVAPKVTEKAELLAFDYHKREFKDSDILNGEYTVVVAATNDRNLNKRISRLAYEKKIPVNIVDDADLCSFIFPAIVKERDVVCAVSSGGKSPYITQHIKKIIKNNLPEKIGIINDIMGEYRIKAKREIADVNERRIFLKKKLKEMLR